MHLTRIKRKATALAAGLAIAGAVGASAASLGGLGTDQLGAANTDVGACDDDGIDVDWAPTWSAASATYVARFTLSDIDLACLNTPYQISIHHTGGGGGRASGSFSQFNFVTQYNRASDGERVARVRYTSQFPAESVEGISIIISG